MADNADKKQIDIDNTGPPLKAKAGYESLFTQLIAPLVATRYLWLAIEDLNPLNFLGKPKPQDRADFKPFKKPGGLRYASRNFAAFGMGATFLGIIGLYSKNTLHDIQSLYSEAVGYELDKKPQDVTLTDIFMKSDNEALKVTRSAYVRRTLARITTGVTFFLPWQKLRDFKEVEPKYDANANMGVGAIGIYLLGERFLREQSFFDAEQMMVSSAIHHNHNNPNQSITSMEIKRLMLLQRRHIDKNYEWPVASLPEGQNQLKLASRIADLMNQTYHNDPATEPAHFTIGKFNFLLGFGMLESFPESLAYVELANRSADMKEVKQVQGAIRSGENAHSAFLKAGIDLKTITAPKDITPEQPSSQPATQHAQKIQPQLHQPKSFTEYAAHTNSSHLAV